MSRYIVRVRIQLIVAILGNCHAYLFGALRMCSSLRKLTLYYSAAAWRSNTTSALFFEALCDHFEASLAINSDLEELALWMMDCDGTPVSVTPQLCTRLARSLLDRRRFPRFRLLRITVNGDERVGGQDMWLSVTDRAKMDRIKERWEDMFGAFRDAQGVHLEVSVDMWVFLSEMFMVSVHVARLSIRAVHLRYVHAVLSGGKLRMHHIRS